GGEPGDPRRGSVRGDPHPSPAAGAARPAHAAVLPPQPGRRRQRPTPGQAQSGDDPEAAAPVRSVPGRRLATARVAGPGAGDGGRMRARVFAALGLAALVLGCAPAPPVQLADQTTLPRRTWVPEEPARAALLAVHGFRDYSHAVTE